MADSIGSFLKDLSLRKTIAVALVVGLAMPIGVSALIHLREQRAVLLERLADDHARIVDVLAVGMQTSIWETRPDAGRPLIEALMLDERVTGITVSSPLIPHFLEAEVPQRRHGESMTQESPVVRNGEEIGRVRVEMDIGRLKFQIASQWVQILLSSLLQFATGMLIIFPLLRYKVLNPLHCLVRQSEALAAGTLDQALAWQRGDELGVLGRSFEETRRSLRELVCDLEKRNRELQEREAALASSEQRFRSIAEAHPVPIVISALNEDRLLYVSPGMVSLFGAPVSEILASPPQAFFADPADRHQIRAMLLDKGAVDSYECSMREADGSTFPAAITARRIDYLGTDAAVGSFINLTKIKRAEQKIARQQEALHQSEKLNALGALLAGVAHELNNPLSIVVGRAIMLEEEVTDPEIRAKAKKIRFAAGRCAKIVKTFLAIARQQPPKRAPVQLNAIIESAVDLVDYGLRAADIQLILNLDPDLPELWADADQLVQVFTNLIINAQQILLEVSPPRRLRITSRFDRSAKVVRIKFTDNGPGVPEEIRPRIFEPFYTRKPVGAGTGIGLSYSYGVIESHGGKILLESPSGGGASFVITLPISGSGTPTEVGAPAEATGVKAREVLIVDDEPEIVGMLADILACEGHRIDIAASGNEALKQIADHDYDLILSDLKMPGLDGPALYKRLQQSHPPLLDRVIFFTGDTLGMGGSDFLTQTNRPLIEKPFIPDEVIQLVRRLLNQAD